MPTGPRSTAATGAATTNSAAEASRVTRRYGNRCRIAPGWPARGALIAGTPGTR